MENERDHYETLQRERGKRMRAAAEAAGFRRAEEVAARIGVEPPSVYRWYSGKAKPRDEFLRAFAELVGRPAAWLLTGQEEPDLAQDFAEFLVQWARELLAGADAAAAYDRAFGEGADLPPEARRLLIEATEELRQAVREGRLPFFRALTVEQREWVARQLRPSAAELAENANTAR
jgi:transcriptional regulator with XRE-family HTH domain